MKLSRQKLKLLYLKKILLEKTDENNTMTVAQMIKELASEGISAERKSIYDDLECLKHYGIDVCSSKTKTHNYFVAGRDFELAELKLLVDSVQASKFITSKKSLELISKLEKLTSISNAKKLHRQVYVYNRVKTFNETIYYNVDKIYEAIAANKQITFKYFDINVDKEKIYRKNGNLYIESPIALSWNDENYYLITYKQKYDNYTNYRVDKMENITILEDKRILNDRQFMLPEYLKSTFGMFGGNETEVTIKFENELVGVVFDRFGSEIGITKPDENHFICTLKVTVSPTFFAWLLSFGSRAEIISPKFVIDEVYKLVTDVKKTYNK